MATASANGRRSIFITGGASGIGLGIADALAARGIGVTITDVDSAAIESVLETRPAMSAEVFDTRDRDAWAKAKAEAEAKAKIAAAAKAKQEAEAKAKREAEVAKNFNASDIAKLLQSKEKAQSSGAAAPQVNRTASLGTERGASQKLSPSLRRASRSSSTACTRSPRAGAMCCSAVFHAPPTCSVARNVLAPVRSK